MDSLDVNPVTETKNKDGPVARYPKNWDNIKDRDVCVYQRNGNDHGIGRHQIEEEGSVQRLEPLKYPD